jgi:hypothetical protein
MIVGPAVAYLFYFIGIEVLAVCENGDNFDALNYAVDHLEKLLAIPT